jgi:hypothetical protein
MRRDIIRLVFLHVYLFWCLVPVSNAQQSQCCKNLPEAVLQALAADEMQYCDRFIGSRKAGCHETFRANLAWEKLKITANGQFGFLIENKTSCGSAGCWLGLFVEDANGKAVQVLGTDGEVGILKNVAVSQELVNEHFIIAKTWKDGKTKTIYRWNGSRYAAD